MNAKDLKNSILQLAVSGKLVEQDASDEPASVLLERIRAERAELIEQKKIKNTKVEPITKDEIPFEVPESWEWVRLGEVVQISGGGTPDKNNPTYWNGDISWASVKDIKGDYLESTINKISRPGLNSKKSISSCVPGDLIVATRLVPGKSIICNINCTINQDLKLVKSKLYVEYLHLWFQLEQPRFYRLGQGTTVPGIKLQDLETALLPLPPLAEQKRIVKRVRQLMPLVEEYGKLEDERQKLDAELPDKLKKSVLQQAVQGKLVPQDPNDEPASVLLERIRVERAELIKQKKIKAPKGGNSIIYTTADWHTFEKRIDAKTRESEPVCIDDELPFEIPPTWEWVRLGEISEIAGGNTPQKTQLANAGNIPYFKVADMNAVGNETEMSVASNYVNDSYSGKVFPKGTIIFPKNGGAVLTNKRRILTKDSVIDLNTAGCTPYFNECLFYVKLFLETIDFKDIYKGTAVPTVNASMVKNFLLPLPPLAEQKRIVEKVHEVMEVIN